jgi:hypothetical protein
MVRGTCSTHVGDRNCVQNFISNSESRISHRRLQRRLEGIENYLLNERYVSMWSVSRWIKVQDSAGLFWTLYWIFNWPNAWGTLLHKVNATQICKQFLIYYGTKVLFLLSEIPVTGYDPESNESSVLIICNEEQMVWSFSLCEISQALVN